MGVLAFPWWAKDVHRTYVHPFGCSSIYPMLTPPRAEQFALTEASYVTVRLMQEFASIESRDSDPWRELFTLTCTGLGGCKVALYPLP